MENHFTPAPPGTIRILIIDDDAVDRMRVERMFHSAMLFGWSIEYDTAENRALGLAALRAKQYDCVLLDFRLPDGDGLEMLADLKAQQGECPPVIMQTTLKDGETALKALAQGAQDYLVKGQFDAPLLMRAIQYAQQRDRLVKERNQLTRELQEALVKVKTLSGLLPICCVCKKIRDDQGYWNKLEAYMTKHSDVSFSHGYCPECMEKFIKDSNLTP